MKHNNILGTNSRTIDEHSSLKNNIVTGDDNYSSNKNQRKNEYYTLGSNTTNCQNNHNNDDDDNDDSLARSVHFVAHIDESSAPYESSSPSSTTDNEANNNFFLLSTPKMPNIRTVAIEISLYTNLFITLIKLIAYIETSSLSVLAAFLDSVLDVVSQIILNYTEKHSSLQRSSAFYPAGASRLEPLGVLICAALMGMASFEVLKESIEALVTRDNPFEDPKHQPSILSFWSMVAIVFVKLLLLSLCNHAAAANRTSKGNDHQNASSNDSVTSSIVPINTYDTKLNNTKEIIIQKSTILHLSDPTLEALGQDHWNDALSNGVASIALLCVMYLDTLWFLDPVGAIIISFYIIYSWYHTGKEQIEQLTGKSAPNEFIEELRQIATKFDEKIIMIDVCRAYHFGPKFLVELEIVLPKETLLNESHDLGMELQYEIEGREEVERCFVHIDYESRPYDEHVVSKVPELREKYRGGSSVGSLSSMNNKQLRHRSATSV